MKIQISNFSYIIEDEIKLELDFNDSPDLLQDLTNININFDRIDVERNVFVFGFGHNPEIENGIVTIKRKIPESFVDGIYLLNGLKLIYDDEGLKQNFLAPGRDIPEIFFWVSKYQQNQVSKLELDKKIQDISVQRDIFRNTLITTKNANQQPERSSIYKVLVFAVGCLLHQPQSMAGYTIYPLRKGYDYNHMHQSVKNFLKINYKISLPYDETIAKSFAHSTPLFVTEFRNVRATDNSDAAYHCSMVAENLFTVLSFEKGQRPNQYATIIIKPSENKLWQSFHFPGYLGNLISGFNTAEDLERIIPVMQKSPWVTLLMQTYGEAISEQNPDFAYLKCWSILEMVAKRRVPNNNENIFYPNGHQIFYSPNQPVKTSSALGKVYAWLFKIEISPSNVTLETKQKFIFETYQDATESPNNDDNTEIFQLWDVVRAAYEIRNSTAHSGSFEPTDSNVGNNRKQIASRLYKLSLLFFLGHIREVTKHVISHELKLENA